MYGYIAAAYTTLICYILFAAGHYIYMSQSVKKGKELVGSLTLKGWLCFHLELLPLES